MPDDDLAVTQHEGRAPAGARPQEGHGPAARDEAQPDRDQPVFHYDLGSPESYLAAERVMAELPVVPEWIPVAAAGLPGGVGGAADTPERRAAVAAQAGRQHVQPLRWPSAWPFDSRRSLIAATYAKQMGRAVAFSLAAFRQAFAGGRALDDDTVLLAGAACEMHPRAVLQALDRRSVAAALDAATAEAAAAGVRELPAIRIGAQVFEGIDAVETAAAALAAAREAR